MARGPRYSLPFRRRREQRTDYKLRRTLILSRRPRAVVRLSNRYVYVQIAEAKPTGDTIVTSASSRELPKMGWKGATGNLPSAYLTGALAGKRALAKGFKEAILDIGLRPSTKGSKLYAALKGLADSGLEVPHSADNLPTDDRVGGSHVAAYMKSLSAEAEAYKKHFSSYIKRGVKPDELLSNFQQVKQLIQSTPQEAKA